jgi:lambda repressor-like predicted transcriptional regulator
MLISRVKEKMEERGKTVLSLSVETQLATETIMRARDHRIRLCKLETLEVIAQALGVAVKDLFEEESR